MANCAIASLLYKFLVQPKLLVKVSCTRTVRVHNKSLVLCTIKLGKCETLETLVQVACVNKFAQKCWHVFTVHTCI